ncbi:MAG TPA: translation elongation factor Ts [bacterium]|nr:translation elongation factor Ts [bacterium]
MIDKSIILKLRQETGAGMVDCQKALEESNGNIEEATEILRKKGTLKAAKKAERATKEGLVALKVSDDKKKGAIVQVNCETDFVSRNENFINLVNELLEKTFAGESAEQYFEEQKSELVMKIGENLQFGREAVIEGAFVVGYLHSNKKNGVLISFDKEIDATLASGIAMHVAAMQPKYLSSEEIPADVIAKEKEIYAEQLKAEGKPENMIEKIMGGKLSKFYEDVCLLNQKYIKDDSKSIQEMIKDAKINSFLLFKF